MSEGKLKDKLISEAQDGWNKLDMIKRVYGSECSYYDGYIDCGIIKEDRIADLEDKLANADYQLEGRDNEIKELEAQLEREKNLNQCMTDNNEQLREMIKKMKCCYNCSKWNDGQCADVPNDSSYYSADFVCKDWEIKEK